VAHLPDEGLDLLEDVGDRTLAAATGARRDALYAEACALVPRLQALDAPAESIPAFGRVFDRALLATKAWKWQHWALPGLLGREADDAEAEAIHTGFDRIARLIDDAPRRLAHRDFKAENLHWPARAPAAGGSLVMIDVQGAFLAPPEYDLVCLLYDLQVDLDEAFVQARLAETLERLPDRPDADEARLRFDALAMARICKDIAHVVHAGRSRGDRRRWHELPRGLILLERVSGRLAHTFPEIRALHSVIPALTGALGSSDSPTGGRRGQA
jgi:aminoglycoside/choline kinase family phosphotransferase